MNLGLAIFLSSIFIGLIFLFHSTKDRWNWKKPTTALISMILYINSIKYSWHYASALFVIIVGTTIYFSTLESDNKYIPTKSIWDIELNDNQDDIIFRKGYPARIDSNRDVWFYEWNDEKNINGARNQYIIFWRNHKVVAILNNSDFSLDKYLAKENLSELIKNNIQAYVFHSKDKLERVYYFKCTNEMFYLYQNKITAFGIFNSKFGLVTANENMLLNIKISNSLPMISD